MGLRQKPPAEIRPNLRRHPQKNPTERREKTGLAVLLLRLIPRYAAPALLRRQIILRRRRRNTVVEIRVQIRRSANLP